MKRFLFFTGILAIFSFTLLAQETLTITTYYPAPFGVYQRLVSQTLGVGDTNSSGGIDAADAPDPSDLDQQGQLWVASRVGIATTSPQNALDVSGAAVIGSNYAGVNTAPDEGLLIEGNVGIGTTTPQSRLHVSGAAVIGSNYAGVNTAPDDGLLIEGNVGIGTTTPQSKLHVSGGVQIAGDNTSCVAAKAGTMRYSNNQIQFCDGADWSNVGGGQPAAPVHGTYRGKNQYRNYQTITLGFRPKVVVIFGIFSGFHMDKPGFRTIVLGIEGNDIIGAIDIIDTGFRVKGVYLNYPASRTYSYLVW